MREINFYLASIRTILMVWSFLFALGIIILVVATIVASNSPYPY